MDNLLGQLMAQPLLTIGGLIILALIAVAIARRQSSSGIVTVNPTPQATQAQPVESGDLAGAVRMVLERGNKIEAVKLVRERTGLGLKEAKDFVDGIERGTAPATIPRTFGSSGNIIGEIREIVATAQDITEEVNALIDSGKQIEAIKLVRERTGLDLKQAKDFVERIEQSRRQR